MSGAFILNSETIEQLRSLGDDDFVREIFEAWEGQAALLLAGLHGALLSRDRKAFRRFTHALAVSSLNVGASAVADVCRFVEAALAHETAVPDSRQFAAIKREFARAATEIQRAKAN